MTFVPVPKEALIDSGFREMPDGRWVRLSDFPLGSPENPRPHGDGRPTKARVQVWQTATIGDDEEADDVGFWITVHEFTHPSTEGSTR